MSTMRGSSKENWTSANTPEHINCGSLQRIADALEIVSQRYLVLLDDAEYLRGRLLELIVERDRLTRSNRSLRGVITRLKRQKAAAPKVSA